MVDLSRKTLLLLLCALLIVILATFFLYQRYYSPTGWKAKSQSDLTHVELGDKILYTTLDGGESDMTAYDSDVLIVNVWASWSPFTKSDGEVLSAIKKAYGESITIRAVNRMEQKETAVAYLDTIGRAEGVEYIIDTTDHLYASLGGYAMPETLVFDRIGNVLSHIRGTLEYERLDTEIKAALTHSQ